MSENQKNNLTPDKEKIDKPITISFTKGYVEALEALDQRIREAKLKVSVFATQELVAVYWDIGFKIIEKQAKHSWRSKVVERLVKELRDAFFDVIGFSIGNVKCMAQIAKAYPDFLISQQAVGQISWGYNVLILRKLVTVKERLWCANKIIENYVDLRGIYLWI